MARQNAVHKPKGMSAIDFERLFALAYQHERKEHPSLPDNVIEVIVRDHFKASQRARPNQIGEIIKAGVSVPFDVAGRVYGGAKQVAGDVYGLGKKLSEPSEYAKRMKEKMMSSANHKHALARIAMTNPPTYRCLICQKAYRRVP